MDRELLIEIGCEEIPAGWLPALTAQMATLLGARLKEFRLAPGGAVESFSTPRRLTARVSRVAERQTDLEDVVTGPPVSAAFKPDGEPTPAAAGFAKKYGVEVTALERHETPKGAYLAHRLRQRGKAAVDVLADVLAALLRDLTFPKQMRWDAYLEDGKGELVFARPIRWIVLLYGGRVVPFVIRRNEQAQGPNVQDVRSGANTYGHRFLTTSGRAGRAIKVKTFDDYQARLLENFVILDRRERESRIRRELDMHARKLSGRVGAMVGAHSSLLQEVPDLVEYPSVVAGHFPVEFLDLPEEVLTTTMIHHQHYFPVVDEEGKLKPAFLAVTNMQAEKPEIIARNSERVLVARLRDARFFWDEDRKSTLESRIDRLSTIVFHKKLGSYRDKADRVASLAAWIAAEPFGRSDAALHAERAGRLCKADLATDMVREFTELQGTMGGIYAREEGLPEAVWKAIYFHYLPIGVEADAPPTRQQLGGAAVTWAAVSLADKLDSVVGMFSAGERPTGSRDPLGLRRQAQGAVKILADLPELTGLDARLTLGPLLARAAEPFGGFKEPPAVLHSFMADRLAYLLEQRGFDVRNIRAVLFAGVESVSPLEARRKLEVLPEFTGSGEFQQLATAFKRVKNIARELAAESFTREETERPRLDQELKEDAERALLAEVERRRPVIEGVLKSGTDYRRGFAEAAAFGPAVDRFFKEVFVMTDEERLRTARLRLMTRLRNLILHLADISEIVPEAHS
jgi:glycyl-tRNA synthetase beta chain